MRDTETFIKTSMPVVEYYRAMDKVVDVRPSPSPTSRLPLTCRTSQIDSSQTIDEVYAVISKALVPVLPKSEEVVA